MKPRMSPTGEDINGGYEFPDETSDGEDYSYEVYLPQTGVRQGIHSEGETEGNASEFQLQQ